MEKSKITFPKGFFSQSRPHISMKEAQKNNIPFEWSENVLNGKSKVKIVSNKKASQEKA